MFIMEIRNPFSGNLVPYGHPFTKIEKAYELLLNLDAEIDAWESRGSPPLSPNDPILFAEWCEIYIKGNGITYWIDECNVIQIMH